MSKNSPTFRIGPIRPPSEAQSLLLQITQGCTWNKCKFCKLYKNTAFKAFSVDSIKADIDAIAYYTKLITRHRSPNGNWNIDAINAELNTFYGEASNCYYTVANWLINGGEHMFLQDGNSLVLENGRLIDVLNYIKESLPQINRITSYGRAESLCKISAEEYSQLQKAGLTRIHSGYESGSDAVLSFINKGVTAQQEIEAGKNIKAGGIELSVYFMSGVGGKALMEENALGTARVISEVNPDYIRIRSTAVIKGSGLFEDFTNGRMELCSDDDKIIELKTLIENCNCKSTMLVSDHSANLLPYINGSLATEKEKMLALIDEYLSLPLLERKVFQVLRRSNSIERVSDLKRLSPSQRFKAEEICNETVDEAQWAEKVNRMLCRFM